MAYLISVVVIVAVIFLYRKYAPESCLQNAIQTILGFILLLVMVFFIGPRLLILLVNLLGSLSD